MRSRNTPPYLRARSQLWSAVRATPTWSLPVGDGAKRTRSGVGSGLVIVVRGRGRPLGSTVSRRKKVSRMRPKEHGAAILTPRVERNVDGERGIRTLDRGLPPMPV